MKQSQNTQPLELIVMRDNAIDADYQRKQRIEAIQTNVQGHMQAVGSFVGNILHNVHTEVALAVHDAVWDTQLRSEREQRLHDEREAAFKAKFRLL